MRGAKSGPDRERLGEVQQELQRLRAAQNDDDGVSGR